MKLGIINPVLGVKRARCAVVAVAHEMARIMYFMLVRGEPYRDMNRGLTEKT